MKELSQGMLHAINDLLRKISWELEDKPRKLKTSASIEVGPMFFDPEDFVRKREVFLDGEKAGTLTFEIDPFV